MLTYHVYQPIEFSIDTPTPPTLSGPQPELPRLTVFTKANGRHFVRFSLTVTGHYSIESGQLTQHFVVTKYVGDNPLFQHGPVELDTDRNILQHADQTPFFWLADTWWFGLTDRATNDAFNKLINLRQTQHFTVVMLVLGTPPEIPLHSKEAHSQGHLPWTNDLSPNPAYFDAIDTKIDALVQAGIVPCLVGGWGPQIQRVGERGMKDWWQMILARYAASPVIFCLTGEIDLPNESQLTHAKGTWLRFIKQWFPSPIKHWLKRHLLSPTKPNHQLAAWTHVGQWLAKNNHYQRPLLVHPHSLQDTLTLLHHPAWLTINSIQSGHSWENRQFLVQQPLMHHPKHLFLNLEPWYEGILGSFGAKQQRYAFWMSVLAGAKGHTYGADGLWNMRTDQDRFLGHWGANSWQKAVTLPGATQLGLAKSWLLQHRWWQLVPVLDAIGPHWSPSNLDGPLTARLDDLTYIVYFPDVTKKAPYWTLLGAWRLMWIDASSMKPVASFRLTSDCQLAPPLPQLSEADAILLIEKL